MKLKNKFYLLFLFTTILVVGAAQTVSFYQTEKALYKRLRERGLALSRALSLACLNAFVSNNFSDLKFYIDEGTKNGNMKGSQIEYIIVTDFYGKVVFHTDSSQNSRVFYDPVSIRATRAEKPLHQIYTTKNNRIYEVSSPVQFGPIKWGTVRVGFNLKALDQAFTKTIYFFILFSLGIIAAVSSIFLLMGDKISRPLERLTGATQKISRGDLSAQIPVTTRDEAGKLSLVFKGMVENLKDANRKLIFYNERLKKKIQDLSTLNSAIKPLRSTLPLERKLALILHVSMVLSQAKGGVFLSCSRGEKTLSLKAQRGQKLDLELFSRLARKAVESKKPVALMNGKETEINLRLPLKKEEKISFFAYPLKTKDTVWGVVVLGLPEESFIVDDLQMVATFLQEANLIIENSLLMETVLESRQMDSLNRLSSLILHDLKGTTAQLSLSLQNARKYYYEPQFREDLLATISSSIEKIQSLAEKISENPLLELKPCSINQILKEIVGELKLREHEYIKLKEEYGDVPPLMLDVSSIKRVFRNIVVNALEAMPQGGTIEISSYLKEPGPSVYIQIKDTGAGMSQDFIDNYLFKPFVTTKEKGLGLALYSAQEIVHLHGGKIEVESRPEKGSIFRIKLPFLPQNSGKAKIRKRLGQYLVDMKFITQEQLKEAIRIQTTDRRKIGKILINRGYIRKSEMIKALEKQKEAEKEMIELIMRNRL